MTIPIQRTFFAFTMAVSVLVVANSPANADKRPSFEELLKKYKELGMPLPPDGTKLVRFNTGWGDGTKQIRSLGFLLKKETKKERAVILCGTREFTVEQSAEAEEIKPDPESLRGLLDNPGIPGVDQFVRSKDYLPLAIQCYDRGWDKLADRFLELAQKQSESPLQTQLIGQAWDYWKQRVATPKIDRAPVAERLRALFLLDKRLDNDENRAFVKALDASLVPSKAKPGSVESLIDGLVDHGSESSDHYEQIQKLGFEAVPALIQHLKDDRLTRFYQPTWFLNNFIKPGHHVTIGALAGELLGEFAGSRATKEWDEPPTKAQAQEWWESAKKIGEETYLLQNVLPKEDEQRPPDSSLIEQMAMRYPKHLASIFRTVLEKRTDLDTQDLAQAIMKCALPKKEKIELFSLAAGNKRYHHRCASLYYLSELDNRQFSKLLLATIEGLPKDVDEEYWSCAEVRAANLIVYTDDPQVWRALEKSAKRAEVGLRMQLINLRDHRDLSLPARKPALRFLGGFLDDSSVRDITSNKDKFILCAGSEYEKIEVRNFAALQIALIAGTRVPENPQRTAQEWARVREKAKEILKLELTSDRKP